MDQHTEILVRFTTPNVRIMAHTHVKYKFFNRL